MRAWISPDRLRPTEWALRRATAGEIAISPRNSPRNSLTLVPTLTALPRSSAGNDSTSVVPFFFREVSIKRTISRFVTKQSATESLPTPSSPITRRRNRSAVRRLTRTLRWRFSTCQPPEALLPFFFVAIQASCRIFDRGQGFTVAPTLGMRGVILLVGPDDLLNEVMADNVLFSKLDHADPWNTSADIQRLEKPRPFAGWQIDLRHVSRDHRLGIESQARQKHLHLFAGGVLGFIQNHE